MMGAYFKPLRRKIGVITLVMACVMTVGWGRSQTKLDLIGCSFRDPEVYYGVRSIDGSLHFYRYSGYDSEDGTWIYSSCPWVAVDASGKPFRVKPWKPKYEIDWRREWGGFYFGVSHSALRRDEDFMIPYWTVVLPLTSLSAWLLLSKPRRPKVKSAEETASKPAV
jgi:hypothetical protein